MIRSKAASHCEDVESENVPLPRETEALGATRPPGSAAGDASRLRTIFDQNFDFVWRSVRRLGLLTQEADDATQQVFLVVARRLESIEFGRERAFLFATALRVASEVRRARTRRAEVGEDQIEERRSAPPSPEDLVDQKRKRELLDEVLDAMPEELRVVLVLFELEGMSFSDMAECLSLPRGTVASRVRRAREQFETLAERRLSRGTRRGGSS
jgi:RNA polymerase sigma-70 factor, ECF subfamily